MDAPGFYPRPGTVLGGSNFDGSPERLRAARMGWSVGAVHVWEFDAQPGARHSLWQNSGWVQGGAPGDTTPTGKQPKRVELRVEVDTTAASWNWARGDGAITAAGAPSQASQTLTTGCWPLVDASVPVEVTTNPITVAHNNLAAQTIKVCAVVVEP